MSSKSGAGDKSSESDQSSDSDTLSITPTNKIAFDIEVPETHNRPDPVGEPVFSTRHKKFGKMEVDLENGQVRLVNIEVRIN